MLKSIQNGAFFKDPGGLFHSEGPMYERPFCPMLVFRKGALSLAKLLLDFIVIEGRTHKLHSNNEDRHC